MNPDAIREYDAAAPGPEETRTATFALGCFWGPDATFGALEGVARTRVGYAGGTTPDPTYHEVGDHSETVQVDYDPEVTGFPELVDVAVDSHDPRRQPASRQYQHVLFYASASERGTVEERLRAHDAAPAETRVEPLDEFTVAEPYHQTYHLRGKRAILAAFESAGYDDAAVRESPAAAKLDAEAAGRDVTLSLRR